MVLPLLLPRTRTCSEGWVYLSFMGLFCFCGLTPRSRLISLAGMFCPGLLRVWGSTWTRARPAAGADQAPTWGFLFLLGDPTFASPWCVVFQVTFMNRVRSEAAMGGGRLQFWRWGQECAIWARPRVGFGSSACFTAWLPMDREATCSPYLYRGFSLCSCPWRFLFSVYKPSYVFMCIYIVVLFHQIFSVFE